MATATATATIPVHSSIKVTATSKAWADSPLQLISTPFAGRTSLPKDIHGADYIAHQMAHLHNIMIRGFNSVYQQAPYVKTPADIKDFLQYITHITDFLHHHHDAEEDVFFPALEKLVGKPGCMEPNVEQHRAFGAGLDELTEYPKTATPETYDGYEVRRIIESFGPVLAVHLADEIGTLQALRLYDSKKLKAIWEKGGSYAQSLSAPAMAVPMIIGSHDLTYEGGVVSEFNLPFFMFWANDLVLSRKFAGCWKFLPCTSRGIPRELQFGPPTKSEK